MIQQELLLSVKRRMVLKDLGLPEARNPLPSGLSALPRTSDRGSRLA